MSADAREGAALELTSAGDVEQLVRARGTLFAVTNRHGDIAPRGAKELGVFFHDTRYLSYYELLVDNMIRPFFSLLMVQGIHKTLNMRNPRNVNNHF